MSIDDGGYPIGTNIEVRKVSSSDWNEPWSRQVRPTIRHPDFKRMTRINDLNPQRKVLFLAPWNDLW